METPEQMDERRSQDDRIDAAMLFSMGIAIRHNLPFSFNTDDMADLLVRVAERTVPAPRPISDTAAGMVTVPVELLSEARAGLSVFTGGEDGACGETIKKIDAVIRAAQGGE